MTNSTQSKVTVASDASKLSFVLHPLPLLNISDFYVRAKNTSQKHCKHAKQLLTPLPRIAV